jgi:hypothetical protein
MLHKPRAHSNKHNNRQMSMPHRICMTYFNWWYLTPGREKQAQTIHRWRLRAQARRRLAGALM